VRLAVAGVINRPSGQEFVGQLAVDDRAQFISRSSLPTVGQAGDVLSSGISSNECVASCIDSA